MTYNILEVIFIVIAVLLMTLFAVLEHRAKKKYRKQLISEFEDKKEVAEDE